MNFLSAACIAPRQIFWPTHATTGRSLTATPLTTCSTACQAAGTPSRYQVQPAPAQRLLEHGDVIDLGNRHFEVIHTPGHSPGGIGLFEMATGIFLSGDVVYDGPLIDDAYHSNREDYVATMRQLRDLPVTVIHGGHFPSFGPTRYHQLIDEYLAGKHTPGCHLANPK